MSIRPKKLVKLKLRVDAEILQRYREAYARLAEVTETKQPEPGSDEERVLLGFDVERMLDRRAKEADEMRAAIKQRRQPATYCAPNIFPAGPMLETGGGKGKAPKISK